MLSTPGLGKQMTNQSSSDRVKTMDVNLLHSYIFMLREKLVWTKHHDIISTYSANTSKLVCFFNMLSQETDTDVHM